MSGPLDGLIFGIRTIMVDGEEDDALPTSAALNLVAPLVATYNAGEERIDVEVDVTAAGYLTGDLGGTDNRVLRADGTAGKTAQASPVAISDAGAVTGVSTLAASGAITGASLALGGAITGATAIGCTSVTATAAVQGDTVTATGALAGASAAIAGAITAGSVDATGDVEGATLTAETALRLGSSTGRATAGEVRFGPAGRIMGRTDADDFDRVMLSWGNHATDTVCLGDGAEATVAVGSTVELHAGGVRVHAGSTRAYLDSGDSAGVDCDGTEITIACGDALLISGGLGSALALGGATGSAAGAGTIRLGTDATIVFRNAADDANWEFVSLDDADDNFHIGAGGRDCKFAGNITVGTSGTPKGAVVFGALDVRGGASLGDADADLVGMHGHATARGTVTGDPAGNTALIALLEELHDKGIIINGT